MHRLFTTKRYGKGSTGFHAAVPPQASDGSSGGAPQKIIAPTLHKPAVLATLKTDPSQGTPGTAISAIQTYPGPTLPRPQHGECGAEQTPANCWKVIIKKIHSKAKQWCAQIHGYYLKLMRKHVALTIRLTFIFVQLIAFFIGIYRGLQFRKSALPYGAMKVFVRDRRYAPFPRHLRWSTCSRGLPRPACLPGSQAGKTSFLTLYSPS